MGDPCKPKNQVATARAANQINGSDIFTEAERVKNFDGDQRAAYERMMANTFGIKTDESTGNTVYDVIKKTSKINAKPSDQFKGAKGSKAAALEQAGGRMFVHPSEQFKGKFWDSIERKTHDKAGKKGNYQKDIAAPVRKVLSAVDKVTQASKSRSELAKNLKPFGLTPDNLYDARDYMTWLIKGGPTQKGELGILKIGASNIAKAQANGNVVWTLGNGVDMIRVASHYGSQKGGAKALLKGLAETVKGGVFKKDARFDKMGLYETQHADRSEAGRDLFSRSIIGQKNFVAHVQEAMGRKPQEGIQEILFDANHWNQPRAYRGPDAGFIFGLARYPISETRYLYKTTKAALGGDGQAALNLLLYNTLKGAIVGSASLVPAAVWQGLPKEAKDAWTAWDKAHNLNLISIVSDKALHAFGIDAHLDLAEYTQPGGGTLGARLKSIVDTGESIAKYSVKAGSDLVQGKGVASLAHGIAAGSAFANLSGIVPAWAKGANSTTITKMLGAVGDSMAHELDGKKTETAVVKAVLGQSVKNDEKPKGSIPDLPDIGSIPDLK